MRVLHRGVYAVTGTPAGIRQLARAAVFATRHPAAAASFETAALVHRAGVLATAGKPHVTLPASVHRPSRPTLTVHRGKMAPEDVVELAGLRVTALPRTLRDLLTARDRLAAGWACEAALRSGAVEAHQLDEAISRCAGQPYSAQMRQWRALVDVRSESPLETAIRLLLADAGLRPSYLSTSCARQTAM